MPIRHCLLLPAGVLLAALLLAPGGGRAAEGPALPEGLGGGGASEGPALPAGLGDASGRDTGGPALPAGLGGSDASSDGPALPGGLGGAGEDGSAAPDAREADDAFAEEALFGEEGGRSRPFVDLTGFWEARLGTRLEHDPNQKQTSLGETRLHLQATKSWDRVTARVAADLLYDPVYDRHAIDLETGEGWLDLREASLLWRASSWLDLKAGRQVLTWGTGDMLFLNDLFPKDWQSFFIGRDDEYLKAPSDAVKASLFSDLVNLDLVYTPRFDADRFISGRRISYYNSALGRRAGRDAVVRVDRPADAWEDDEWALRFYRTLQGWELALYAYDGFWKSPSGQDPVSGLATFPRLRVVGASARGTILGGIGNAEIACYDSTGDDRGDDPFVPNDQWRLLLGYEREVGTNLTMGLQWYAEWMQEHAAYRKSAPPGMPRADELRQVVTLRLTKLLRNQNLRASVFAYYSPTDGDASLRPRLHYTVTDRWAGEVGGTVFLGEEEHTFFSQFETASNVFGSIRFSF